jgi:Mg-chelatase subunit ChlI
VDGHRADLVILKAARAHAALHARQTIADTDIALAAELALPHRVKRGPFQQAEVNLYNLEERIEQIQSEFGGEEGEPEPSEVQNPVKKNRA